MHSQSYLNLNVFICEFVYSQVVVEAGLYHGSNALCETQTTQEVSVRDGEAVIEETLSFGIDVCNIPRSTRLCLAIYEVTRSAKATKARSSIGTRPVSAAREGFVNLFMGLFV